MRNGTWAMYAQAKPPSHHAGAACGEQPMAQPQHGLRHGHAAKKRGSDGGIVRREQRRAGSDHTQQAHHDAPDPKSQFEARCPCEVRVTGISAHVGRT